MSYKCMVCGGATPRGQPQCRHIVYRPDGSILKEYQVCAECHREFLSGKPLSTVLLLRGSAPTKKRSNAVGRTVPAVVGPVVKNILKQKEISNAEDTQHATTTTTIGETTAEGEKANDPTVATTPNGETSRDTLSTS